MDMGIVKELLKPMAEDGAAMTRQQAAAALEEILAGQAPEVETAALVAVMATRGEQAPELAGFVDVMRARVTPVPLTQEERATLVDVVGTGGGGPLTFNISSGAALVAAAAGAKVAKHGNRAVTSRCGAADVLEALGVPIDLKPELAVECLRDTGFMFLFAPLYHPAMRVVGPLRRSLQSLRPAHQSSRCARSGHRRARAQQGAAGWPHPGGAWRKPRLCCAWH
jgi:anthranilate phosphoribosyltransferase